MSDYCLKHRCWNCLAEHGRLPSVLDRGLMPKKPTQADIDAYRERRFPITRDSIAEGVGVMDIKGLPTPPDDLGASDGLHPYAVPHDGKDDKAKPAPSLLFTGCANALAAVLAVLTFGAKKYAADSWQKVPDGKRRYWEAVGRHKMEIDKLGLESVDDESKLLHLDHLICDALFIRELIHRERDAK